MLGREAGGESVPLNLSVSVNGPITIALQGSSGLTS